MRRWEPIGVCEEWGSVGWDSFVSEKLPLHRTFFFFFPLVSSHPVAPDRLATHSDGPAAHAHLHTQKNTLPGTTCFKRTYCLHIRVRLVPGGFNGVVGDGRCVWPLLNQYARLGPN